MSRSKKSRGSWRRRERQAQHLQHTALSAQQKDQVLNEAKTLHPNSIAAQPKLSDIGIARMAHTNWKFVEQLLKVILDSYILLLYNNRYLFCFYVTVGLLHFAGMQDPH